MPELGTAFVCMDVCELRDPCEREREGQETVWGEHRRRIQKEFTFSACILCGEKGRLHHLKGEGQRGT